MSVEQQDKLKADQAKAQAKVDRASRAESQLRDLDEPLADIRRETIDLWLEHGKVELQVECRRMVKTIDRLRLALERRVKEGKIGRKELESILNERKSLMRLVR